MTELTPPMQWYPSVGGWPTAPKVCNARGCTIVKCRWTNISLAKRSEVVNPTVKAASLSIEDFLKAVTAGYPHKVPGRSP
jgi:hypothetical protein